MGGGWGGERTRLLSRLALLPFRRVGGGGRRRLRGTVLLVFRRMLARLRSGGVGRVVWAGWAFFFFFVCGFCCAASACVVRCGCRIGGGG